MIYLLIALLALLGGGAHARRYWRRYQENVRVNRQKDYQLAYPCGTCGWYPDIIQTQKEIRTYHDDDGDPYKMGHYHYSSVPMWCVQCCGSRVCSTISKVNAVEYWNKRYGITDRTELELIRAGIRKE